MGDSSRSSTLFFDAIQEMEPSEPINGVHVQLSKQALLDKIDKLRDLGVHKFVALPQLVVVGDQSSGKSSVLEAVMELPLPRDDTLCTRFATNITFRRSPQTSVAVSIIPGPSRSNEKKEQLKAFKKVGLTSLDGETFLPILKEACQAMGVPGPKEPLGNGKPTFSEDVFKIELCGPDRDNLSIIDIPGIFRTPDEKITTQEDIEMVKKMVHSWIQDERTVILAVLGANVEIATQEILSIAKEADPEGLRTVGVLTKPDLVDAGAEERVFDLVNGKRNKLKLGYCVVRNRSQIEHDHDTSSVSRGSKERDFFNSEPWSALPRDRVGVGALKTLLKDLLAEIVKREFPKIKGQLDRDLIQARNRLARIGTERKSPGQQKDYLEGIAAKFAEISKCALSVDYSRHEILKDDRRLRLPTLMADRCDRFVEELRTKGHTIEFHKEEGEESEDDEDEGFEESDDDEDEELEAASSKYENGERENEVILEAPASAYPDLDNVLQHNLDILPTREHGILDWIKAEQRESRGYSLQVNLNTLLLWQKQSRNWKGITFSFINDAIVYVHDFICRLLRHICPDSKVRNALLSFIMDDLLAKYTSAIEHVDFILQVEHSALLSKNRDFRATLKEMRNARLIKAIKGSAFTTTKINGVKCIPIKDIEATAAALATSKGNLDDEVKDAHDHLHAYYKVAMARFVDTVMAQGIHYHLLTAENSPIKIIAPGFTSSSLMRPRQLEEIAGEDAVTKRERQALTEKIAALERGKEALRA